MFVAYCYKLKPNKKQAEKMTNWLNMLRANYNFSLRDRIEAYEQARSPILGNYSRLDNQGECCPLSCSVSKNATIGIPWKNNGKKRSAYEQQSSNLPILKKQRPWYADIHSTVLQQNLKRLNKAFDNFFKGQGYPKFKRRSKFRSFCYSPGQVKVNDNSVFLPGIGWMSYFNSRVIPKGFKVKTVTIRLKADGWYISIRLEDKTIPDVPKIELNQVKNALAGDLGIKKLISLSDDTIIPNPKFFQKYERRKAIRQRRASRKKKGSKNRAKAYQYLAKIDQKIVNERNDYHWKIANKLCRKAEVLIFEKLNIQGLLKKCQPKQDGAYKLRGKPTQTAPHENGKYLKNGREAKKALSRLISDAAWGELKLKIKSVADKLGLHFVEVDPKNSSRQCRKCGYIDKKNRNKERFFCLSCHHLDDSDISASKILLDRGLKQLGISEGLWAELGSAPCKPRPNQLPSVRRKVTTKETSLTLVDEPSNPNKNEQLLLFDFDGEGCSRLESISNRHVDLWSANLVIS